MPAPLFEFTTNWKFPHDLDTIWNYVSQIPKYPQWWPGIVHAKLIQGNEGEIAIANQFQFTVASPLYTLHYQTETRDYEPGKYIAIAATGDLSGTGRWEFRHLPKETHATFTWHVSITPPLLRTVSYIPPIRPIMRFFHNRLMSAGEKGLGLLLKRQTALRQNVLVM